MNLRQDLTAGAKCAFLPGIPKRRNMDVVMLSRLQFAVTIFSFTSFFCR